MRRRCPTAPCNSSGKCWKDMWKISEIISTCSNINNIEISLKSGGPWASFSMSFQRRVDNVSTMLICCLHDSYIIFHIFLIFLVVSGVPRRFFFVEKRKFHKLVQNRLFDLPRPPIEVKVYCESHGNNHKIYWCPLKIKKWRTICS